MHHPTSFFAFAKKLVFATGHATAEWVGVRCCTTRTSRARVGCSGHLQCTDHHRRSREAVGSSVLNLEQFGRYACFETAARDHKTQPILNPRRLSAVRLFSHPFVYSASASLMIHVWRSGGFTCKSETKREIKRHKNPELKNFPPFSFQNIYDRRNSVFQLAGGFLRHTS